MPDNGQPIPKPASPLDPAQQRRAAQVQRFLVNILDPQIGPRALKEGYDEAEHRLGWELWMAAVGVHRPFTHSLTEAQIQLSKATPSETTERIAELDAFENKWFPRVRAAIRRHVARDEREVFEEAFFADMPQQPLGPLVVGSVQRFLSRLEGMKASDVPGARDAYQNLVKKGLTPQLIAKATELVEEATSGPELPPIAAVDPEEIQAAARTQLEAFEELDLWYRDWAGALRSELGYHACVKLGITTARRPEAPGSGGGGGDD